MKKLFSTTTITNKSRTILSALVALTLAVGLMPLPMGGASEAHAATLAATGGVVAAAGDERIDLDDSDIDIKCSAKDLSYTGKAQKPQITLKRMDNGYVLVEGKDYKITYLELYGFGDYDANDYPGVKRGAIASLMCTEAGDYCVTIEGIGNYKGKLDGVNSEDVYFKVKETRTHIGDDRVQAAASKYTGKAVTPKVTLGGKTLKAGTDYKVTSVKYGSKTLSGTNKCIKPGTYSLAIQGIGGYFGAAKVSFEITETRMVFSGDDYISIKDVTYNGKTQTPYPTKFKHNGKTLKAGRDFKVTLAKASGSSKGKTVYKTVKSCKNAGAYKVTYKGLGKTCIGTTVSYFYVNQCTIKEWDADIKVSNLVYNGKYQTPKVVVKYKGKTLKAGRDYRVSYSPLDTSGQDYDYDTDDGKVHTRYMKKVKVTGIYCINVVPTGNYGESNVDTQDELKEIFIVKQNGKRVYWNNHWDKYGKYCYTGYSGPYNQKIKWPGGTVKDLSSYLGHPVICWGDRSLGPNWPLTAGRDFKLVIKNTNGKIVKESQIKPNRTYYYNYWGIGFFKGWVADNYGMSDGSIMHYNWGKGDNYKKGPRFTTYAPKGKKYDYRTSKWVKA